MMRAVPIFLAAAAILFVQANPAMAQKPAAAQGFDAFKMVRTRNIFDPDRRPPPSQSGSAASAVPIAQSDYVALTGTLVTPEKALAFFSGSRADFDKVLAVKEKIAGATIAKITPGSVTIERAGKTSNVAVGWTIPLNGSASAPAPAPAAMPDAVTQPAPSLNSAVGGALAPLAPGNPVTGAAPAGASPSTATPNPDVARMMRERRLQEQP
jgi:hypothetical protein